MATSSYTHRVDAVSGLPFDVRLNVPTKETFEAMLEAERIAKDSEIAALNADDALKELRR
jgi:antitoxin component of RelBE/YafQ-DinJ toxin-antitoxin module